MKGKENKKEISNEKIDELIFRAGAKAEELSHHYDKFVQLEAKEIIIVMNLLEELKANRATLTKTNKHLETNYRLGYNKAIADFKKKLLESGEKARPVGWTGYSMIVTCEKIIDIANELLTEFDR